jgi:hypothetical protein
MDGMLGFAALVGLISVALAFDFLNGLHDAANSIATVVSTRTLRPQVAVMWASTLSRSCSSGSTSHKPLGAYHFLMLRIRLDKTYRRGVVRLILSVGKGEIAATASRRRTL